LGKCGSLIIRTLAYGNGTKGIGVSVPGDTRGETEKRMAGVRIRGLETVPEELAATNKNAKKKTEEGKEIVGLGDSTPVRLEDEIQKRKGTR